MKRIVINLASILLTFTFGVAVAPFWNWNKYKVKNEQPRVNVIERCQTNQTESTGSTVISAATAPNREVSLLEVG
jgi:flagellar basal body-associated protein FliL